MGTEHERGSGGHNGDVIDKDHSQVLEAANHLAVVDDLVIAVHGRLEGPNQRAQSLDGHLHARTEPRAARPGGPVRLPSTQRSQDGCWVSSGTCPRRVWSRWLPDRPPRLSASRSATSWCRSTDRCHATSSNTSSSQTKPISNSRSSAAVSASTSRFRNPSVSHWESRSTLRCSIRSAPVTTTARFVSSINFLRACGRASISRTTTTGCRFSTATSRRSPGSRRSISSASSPNVCRLCT